MCCTTCMVNPLYHLIVILIAVKELCRLMRWPFIPKGFRSSWVKLHSNAFDLTLLVLNEISVKLGMPEKSSIDLINYIAPVGKNIYMLRCSEIKPESLTCFFCCSVVHQWVPLQLSLWGHSWRLTWCVFNRYLYSLWKWGNLTELLILMLPLWYDDAISIKILWS